jgi:hypothetical protein
VVIPASVDEFFVRAQWELEMLTMTLPPKQSKVEPRFQTTHSTG